MIMAEYSQTSPASSLCSCSSLSTAFMRFKQDNENIRADIEELKYKSRTLPRIASDASLSDILEAPERWNSQTLIPSIERKLDRLTTLLEGVAIDVKTQRDVYQRDAHAPQHGCWRCPGCGVNYRIEEDTSTLRPTPAADTTSNYVETINQDLPADELEGSADQGETMAMSGRSATPEADETGDENVEESQPSLPRADVESAEREETESASAEVSVDDLNSQIRQSNIKVRELEMKTAELLRMNYTWQEYFQIMTARMDDERFLWRLQLGELDRNVDSGPLLAQLHERLGLMERERLESLEKINALSGSVREGEERLRLCLEEMEKLRNAAAAVPPEPSPCDECARLSSQLADCQERCAWLGDKLSSAEERCLEVGQKNEELMGRSDALLAEAEGLREQLEGATAEAEKASRRVAQLQAECESLRLSHAAMEARREGDTSPTQLSQLGHMQTISAWNCPSCNCKNPPFTPMCHKCHRGQRPPPFNPYVLDRS